MSHAPVIACVVAFLIAVRLTALYRNQPTNRPATGACARDYHFLHGALRGKKPFRNDARRRNRGFRARFRRTRKKRRKRKERMAADIRHSRRAPGKRNRKILRPAARLSQRGLGAAEYIEAAAAAAAAAGGGGRNEFRRDDRALSRIKSHGTLDYSRRCSLTFTGSPPPPPSPFPQPSSVPATTIRSEKSDRGRSLALHKLD